LKYTPGAVNEARRLEEIKFPEFTAKLVTDTFDALIAANIRQQEAYSALLKATAQELTTYINETKDDIGGEMILQFLANVVSAPEKLEEGSLNDAEAKAIADAVQVTDEQKNVINTITVADVKDKTKYDAVLQAIAKRIAADKYALLKDMVKMGVLRLIVETGVIETKLTFKTYASDYYCDNASNYNSSSFSVNASAKTGSFLSLWCKAAASTNYTSVGISTANRSSSGSSGSSVEIFGRVQINFKTDYQQLSTT
jgi:hypothetical protein